MIVHDCLEVVVFGAYSTSDPNEQNCTEAEGLRLLTFYWVRSKEVISHGLNIVRQLGFGNNGRKILQDHCPR